MEPLFHHAVPCKTDAIAPTDRRMYALYDSQDDVTLMGLQITEVTKSHSSLLLELSAAPDWKDKGGSSCL